MTLTLIIVAAIGVVAFAERSLEHLLLAIAAFCFATAALLLVVADFERAILLSSILVAAIYGASKRQVSSQRIEADRDGFAAAVRRHGAVFFPAVSAGRIGGSRAGSIVLFVLAAIATLFQLAGPPVSRRFAWSCSASRLPVWWSPTGEAAGRSPCGADRRRAALLFLGLRRLAARPVVLAGIRRTGAERYRQGSLLLLAAVPARRLDSPDIVVIQHELIFDPRVYGLPVEPIVEGFLSPEGGVHGA